MISEELIIEDKVILAYNYQNGEFENNIKEASKIDLNKRTHLDMSVLKFIYNNTIYWPNDNPVYLMMNFVNNMLWFRSLEGNEFMGSINRREDLNDFIIKNNYLEKFNNFLTECGQNYDLCEMVGPLGKKVIGIKYKNGQAIFDIVASSGAIMLRKLFCLINKGRQKEVSFIFIDDFDAFYSDELALNIFKKINKNNHYQSILTSHNPFLIDNEIMRSDCYAILKDGKLITFVESTNKTFRSCHILEK